MTTRHKPTLPAICPTMEGLTIRQIVHPEWSEYFLTATPTLTTDAWLEKLDSFCQQTHSQPVAIDVLGSVPFVKQQREAFAGRINCPCNFLIGKMESAGGFQAHVISGIPLTPVQVGGRLVGYRFTDTQSTYCLLSDLRPSLSGGEARQTEDVFELMEEALADSGLNFHDVARTWFYLDRILDWYPTFNQVRTAFFDSRQVFGGIMPASTGVGAANLSGAALLAKLYAMRPKSDTIWEQRVDSPLQCDAYQYGSAFSRAVEINDGASRTLYISGTASIEPGGKTVHVGDVSKQMELTLQVVEAILKHRGFSWSDTIQGIAYFRYETDLALWKQLPPAFQELPVVVTQCDVCRDDLLFEIELAAATAA